MQGSSEVTSDYSDSLSSTSSEEEKCEKNLKLKTNENATLVWTSSTYRKIPLILFRPESLITRDRRLKSIGEKYNLSYKMVKTESKLVRSVLAAYGFREVHPNSADFNLMWTGSHLKPFSLRSLQDFQKVNHFPRSYEITRKDRLYKNIERMAHTKGVKHFDFVPKSFLMPSEYQEFCAAFIKDRGSWIVKPIASSRGRGIYLVNNPSQVPLEDNLMVCKYINNPLLIDGFKFDVRLYVAITSYDPLLIYLFEEGLTRFATVKYEKATKYMKNQMMHLTNYSINKKSEDYVRCEDPDVEDYGNKWSMSAMLRYLKQAGIDTSLLMSRVETVIIKSILAAELPIATACKMFVPHRENCIELYGFDILIDENLKPWVLEGNLSPSLACDAPLDLKIKSSMIADFLSIAGLRCVDSVARRASKKSTDSFQRPYSAQQSPSATDLSDNRGGSRNKRPCSAGYNNICVAAAKNGLSIEESRILASVKDQFQRRGSFIRIFPTIETWDHYSPFLEFKSNLNFLLAQKLFPRTGQIRRSYSAAVAKMKSLKASQMLENRRQIATERFLQYERKLFTLEAHKKSRSLCSVHKKTSNCDTPVGIDNKFRKQLSKAHHSSSEEESDDIDQEEEEKREMESSFTNKKPTKSNHSLNAGDATTPSKPTKQELKTPVDRIPKSKSTPSMKSCKSEQDCSGNSSNRKSLQSLSLKSAVVAKSTPRVYMYKCNTPNETVSPSPAAQSPVADYKSDSATNPTITEKSESDSSLSQLVREDKISLSSISSLSQEIAKKIEVLSQKRIAHKAAQNHHLVNVLSFLKSGGNLRKHQARQAFSTYLSRVQHRLRMESEGFFNDNASAICEQEERMELVLRFLRRAAGNFCQSFSVTVPSRRLDISERKRMLSKQLAEFVRIYNKESDASEHKHCLGLEKDASAAAGGDKRHTIASPTISDKEFRNFILNASESALEDILTVYTHKNKSASLFLGAAKMPATRYYENEEAASSERLPTNVLSLKHGKVCSVPSTPVGSPSYYVFSAELNGEPRHSSASSARRDVDNVKLPSSRDTTGRSASAMPFVSSAGHVFRSNQSSELLNSTSNHVLAGRAQHCAGIPENANPNPHKTTKHCSVPVHPTHPELANMSPAQPYGVDSLAFDLNANSDSSHEHSRVPYDLGNYQSPQRLTQQSSSLLQQSKAKHQAVLSQMLNTWRNRQQAEMSAQYAQQPATESTQPSSKDVRSKMYRYQPCPAAGKYSSFKNSSKQENNVRQATEEKAHSHNYTNLKDFFLLQRTEKLIKSTPRESTSDSENTFLKQVLAAGNRNTIQQPTKKARPNVNVPESNKLTMTRTKQPINRRLKQSRQVLPTPIHQQASADRMKSSETVRNIFYYENILKEINSLFEMGELPTKQWKDAYKRKRK